MSKMNTTPTVSIVVCTYNGEKYIREQVDSLIAQTYPIHEIIIQDDGSTDNTWTIVEELVAKYPTIIKGIRNEHNLGWNQNFYAAIMNTTGDYIACCDQDDYWMPDKIERQVQEIGNKLLHVCSSYLWKNGELTPRINHTTTLENMSLYFAYCGHQFLMKNDMKKYIPLGQRIDMAHDRFLSLVAQYLNSITVSDALLVKWRRHETNTTGDLKIDSSTGVQKIKYSALKLLLRGGSPVIKRAGNKYYQLFKYMHQTNGKPKYSKEIMTMWKLLMRQTFFGYLRVGFLLWKMRKEIGVFGKQTNIKTVYSVFTYPFRWWYIHKEDL